MIKNTSIILLLNIFLFSGMANAEKVGTNLQDGTNGMRSDPISDAEDTAQLEKHAKSNEISSGTAKPDQKEKTNSPADNTIGVSEEKIARDKAAADREMAARVSAAKREAAREMAARVRVAKQDAAREMAARVRVAKQDAAREMAAQVRAAREDAAREMAARVRAAKEDAAREMAARVSAAKEEAARAMAVQVKAAKEKAAREMASRAKERAARERDYHERMYRYEAEREHFKKEGGYYRAPF